MKKQLISTALLITALSPIITANEADAVSGKTIDFSNKKIANDVKHHRLVIDGMKLGQTLGAADKLKNTSLYDSRKGLGTVKVYKKYFNAAYNSNTSIRGISSFQENINYKKRKITVLNQFEPKAVSAKSIKKVYGQPAFIKKDTLGQSGLPAYTYYYKFGTFVYYADSNTLGAVYITNFKTSKDLKRWSTISQLDKYKSIKMSEWKNKDMTILKNLR